MRWTPGDEPAELWTPILSEVFGWHPWDIERLTTEQWNAAAEYLRERTKA